MKLLLTGATGFVGRTLLLEVLRSKRYEQIFAVVRSIDKLKAQLNGEGFSSLPPEIVPVVSEAPNWDGLSDYQADHVVHSAGVLFASSQKEYFDTNVDGTRNLLAQLKGKPRAVILSSQAAAGPCRKSGDVLTEGSIPRPLTWYGKSKLEMERILDREFKHLDYLCLRPAMVFGPRDTATLRLFKIANQRVRVKPGIAKKRYSFVGVEDLVSAILKALQWERPWSELGGRTFFIASSHVISDRDMVNAAAKAVGKKGILVPLPQSMLYWIPYIVDAVPALRSAIPMLTRDRSQDIWQDRWVVSPGAFERELDWEATTSLAESFEETCRWYRDQGQL